MKRSIILSAVWLAMTLSPCHTVLAQAGNEAVGENTVTTTQQPPAEGGDVGPSSGKEHQGNSPSVPSLEKNQPAQEEQDNPLNADESQEENQRQDLSAQANHVMSGGQTSETGGYDAPLDIPQRPTPEDSGSGMMGWLALFLAAAALAVAIYNYRTLHPKKDKKRSSRQQEQASASGSKQLQELVTQNRAFTDSINRLASRVNDMEARIERLSRQSQGTPTPHTGNGGGGTPVQQQGNSGATRYATTVLGDGFPEDSLTDANSNYVIAVLTIKGDTGSFVINDQPGAQSFLISNFAYGAGRVCDIQQQNSSPTRVQTNRPGTVQRQGNSWKVTSKAQVSLV